MMVCLGRIVIALFAAALMLPAVQACSAPIEQNPKLEPYSDDPQAHKINVNLLRLEERVRDEHMSWIDAASAIGIVTTPEGVMLDIVTRALGPDVQKKFLIPGVTIVHFSPTYSRVAAIIDDPALLHTLAQISEVTLISPEYGATTQGGAQRLQRVTPEKSIQKITA